MSDFDKETSRAAERGKTADGAGHERKRPGAEAAISPGQVTKLAAGPTGIAAAPRVDLGDRAVDTTHVEDVFISNLDAGMEAYVAVRFEGSPAIALVSAPTRLRPSREGFDPSTAIRLSFTPSAKGHVAGTLIVQAQWQTGARPPEVIQIAVDGAAHEVGQPTVAEQEAAQAQQQAQAQAAKRDQDAMVAAQRADDARLDRNEVSGTAASRERLQRATDDAASAMGRLMANRSVGVNTAQGEAAKYHHRAPPHVESLIERLAFAALDAATDGIAGALGKAVEEGLAEGTKVAAHTVFTRGVRVAESASAPPSRAVVAFFTSAVEDVAKQGGAAAVEHVRDTGEHSAERAAQDRAQTGEQEAPGGMRDPGPSTDPLLAFFAQEHLGLIRQDADKAKKVANEARLVLEPMLDSQAKQAITSMQVIAREIDQVASSNTAMNLQRQQSALHWIEYVAQASLGSVSAESSRAAGQRTAADGGPTADIQSANAAPTARGAPQAQNGLVDVGFTADLADPGRPVVVKTVRVTGVSNAIARELAGKALRDANLAVRAYGLPTNNDAIAGIEVIRDEAGNTQVSDQTGAFGPGNWFARRIGEPDGGPDAEIRGARTMMEEEILPTAFKKKEIHTDSDDE